MEELKCPYCGAIQECHEPDEFSADICVTECEECEREFEYSVRVERLYWAFGESEVEENMLPEVCSCGYRFETDETICPNCGKKVEVDG